MTSIEIDIKTDQIGGQTCPAAIGGIISAYLSRKAAELTESGVRFHSSAKPLFCCASDIAVLMKGSLIKKSDRRMLTNSRDIKRRLESEGWILERVSGSHHIFKHPQTRQTVVLPHPKKDLGRGLVRNIYSQAGWEPD